MPYADPERQREYMREWYARRRAEWFEGKVCVDCGSTDRLELDHVDPATKVSHRIWSWSKARREAELAKCVVRCHDHHRAKTLASDDCRQHGKVTLEQADEIRALYAAGGTTQREIGTAYGMSHASVSKIVLGTTYRRFRGEDSNPQHPGSRPDVLAD